VLDNQSEGNFQQNMVAGNFLVLYLAIIFLSYIQYWNDSTYCLNIPKVFFNWRLKFIIRQYSLSKVLLSLVAELSASTYCNWLLMVPYLISIYSTLSLRSTVYIVHWVFYI
jgi:hypothetical protein